MEKQTTIRWDNDLYKKVLALSVKENRPFAAMVKEMLLRYLRGARCRQ